MSELRRIRVSDLRITNPYLSNQKVEELVEKLKIDPSINHELNSVYVREKDGGLYVVDGNHFIQACILAKIEWVWASVFSIDDQDLNRF